MEETYKKIHMFLVNSRELDLQYRQHIYRIYVHNRSDYVALFLLLLEIGHNAVDEVHF